MTEKAGETTTAFVGFTPTSIDQLTLQSLIEKYFTGKVWNFLKWPHKVTFNSSHPSDFTCTEGQVFNQDRELRWARSSDTYSVLLLSRTNITDDSFERMAGDWRTRDLAANIYPQTETRFPKGFTYPDKFDTDHQNVGQRYFLDAETGTVHFISLRVL